MRKKIATWRNTVVLVIFSSRKGNSFTSNPLNRTNQKYEQLKPILHRQLEPLRAAAETLVVLKDFIFYEGTINIVI